MTMEISNKTSKVLKSDRLLKTWPQVFLFYFIGLSLFFITAFLIVTLRVSYKGEIQVPSLIGKTYLEEHNYLQKNGFEIILKSIHSTNYPYGYIISQSLSPGKIVKIGQKIILLVNQSKNIVKTPFLIGSLDSLAPKILSNAHSDKRRFKLIPGIVSYIPSDQPKGEILAQYPLAETPVPPEYPVSYLVSAGTLEETSDKKVTHLEQKNNLNQKAEEAIANASSKGEGLNIEIVKSMAYHLKVPLEIYETSVNDPEQDSFVIQSQLSSKIKTNIKPIWEVKVGRYKNLHLQEEIGYPFQFIWINTADLDIDQGIYTIAQEQGAKNTKLAQIKNNYAPSLFYLSLKKDQSLPFFKTFNDQFFIWDGYYNTSNNIREFKKAKKIYRPENIIP